MDIFTNRMNFLFKERNVICEITVEVIACNLTVMYSDSFFYLECSTTGIGSPIENILKNNFQCGFLLKHKYTNRWNTFVEVDINP